MELCGVLILVPPHAPARLRLRSCSDTALGFLAADHPARNDSIWEQLPKLTPLGRSVNFHGL
eukprot:8339959-Pyramimonas_sp.AAC.1